MKRNFVENAGWPYPGYLGDEDLIAVHHVGGRGGVNALAADESFNRDFIWAIYDADTDCAAEMVAATAHNGRRQIVLPYCLSDKKGPAEFRLMQNPCPSSMLKRGEATEYICMHSGVHQPDWLFAEHIRTMEIRQIEATTLDDICEVGPRVVPGPNVLILDAQGVELEIIEGGLTTIRRHTLAMVIESSMVKFYENQRLFGEMCERLNALGFTFTRFSETVGHYNYLRAPFGFHSRGTLACSDGIFLRKPESIVAEPDPIRSASLLSKLAFLGVVFNELEFTFRSLALLNGICTLLPFSTKTPNQNPPLYLKFLQELNNGYLSEPKLYRDTATERLGDRELRLGRTSGRALDGLDNEDIALHIANSQYYDRVLPEIRACMTTEGTTIENTLANYKFTAQSQELKEYRVTHVNGFVDCINLGRVTEPRAYSGRPELAEELGSAGQGASWVPAAHLSKASPNGLHFLAHGDDPVLLMHPVDIDPREHRYLVITMALGTVAATSLGQFFWCSEGENSFTEEHALSFPVTCDGMEHTYVIDLWFNSSFDRIGTSWIRSSKIVGLRFDPVSCAAEILITSIGTISPQHALDSRFRAAANLPSKAEEVRARWMLSSTLECTPSELQSKSGAIGDYESLWMRVPPAIDKPELRRAIDHAETQLRHGGALILEFVSGEQGFDLAEAATAFMTGRWMLFDRVSTSANGN